MKTGQMVWFYGEGIVIIWTYQGLFSKLPVGTFSLNNTSQSLKTGEIDEDQSKLHFQIIIVKQLKKH